MNLILLDIMQKNNYNYNHICNVCLKSKNIVLFNKIFNKDDSLEWFEKSIIQILGNKSINYNIVFCTSCFHIFVSSNIDSLLLYSKESAKIRESLFLKQYPYKKYKYNLAGKFHKKLENKRIRRITNDILLKSNSYSKKDINILDYGGDDGYIIDQIKDNINANKSKKFFFEIYDPQTHKNLINKKFDILIVSHVLEHISNLDNIFDDLKKYLHKDSFIIIEVPDERSILFKLFLKKRIFLDYHLNYFTNYSLMKFFFRKQLHIESKYIFSSYRGNKIMSIYGIAYYSKKSFSFSKFMEIINLILFIPRRIFFSYFT